MTEQQAILNGYRLEDSMTGLTPKPENAKRISVEEASKRLNVSMEAIMKGMKQKVLPIGFIIESESKYRKYSYYIFDNLVDAYLAGKLTVVNASPVYLW